MTTSITPTGTPRNGYNPSEPASPLTPGSVAGGGAESSSPETLELSPPCSIVSAEEREALLAKTEIDPRLWPYVIIDSLFDSPGVYEDNGIELLSPGHDCLGIRLLQKPEGAYHLKTERYPPGEWTFPQNLIGKRGAKGGGGVLGIVKKGAGDGNNANAQGKLQGWAVSWYISGGRPPGCVAKASSVKGYSLSIPSKLNSSRVFEVLDSTRNQLEQTQQENARLTNSLSSKEQELQDLGKAVRDAEEKQQELIEKGNDEGHLLRDLETHKANLLREIDAIKAERNNQTNERNRLVEVVRRHAFTVDDWNNFYGGVNETSPIPEELGRLLEQPCPFSRDRGKQIKDTHHVGYVPRRVNGQPLTLAKIIELLAAPTQGGRGVAFRLHEDLLAQRQGIQPLPRGCYVLMTKTTAPGSLERGYDLFFRNDRSIPSGYQPLSFPIAAAVIGTHFAKTGETTYPSVEGENPTSPAFTFCSDVFTPQQTGQLEHVVVGALRQNERILRATFAETPAGVGVGLMKVFPV